MALALGWLEGSEAFARLYSTYGPRVAGLARRFLKGTAAAHAVDDVVQETLLRAYRSGIHLDDDQDPWPWLATVARNLCRDSWRRGRVDPVTAAPFEEPVGPAPGPEVTVEHQARAAYVAEALGALPARQRRLLLLRHVEDVPCAEIARAESTTVEAVKSALGRARDAFRARYEGWRGVVPGVLSHVGARLRAFRDAVTGFGPAATPTLRPGIAGALAALLAFGFVMPSTSASEPPGAPSSEPPRVAPGPRAVIEQPIAGDASASPTPAGGRLISFQPPESPDVPPTPASSSPGFAVSGDAAAVDPSPGDPLGSTDLGDLGGVDLPGDMVNLPTLARSSDVVGETIDAIVTAVTDAFDALGLPALP